MRSAKFTDEALVAKWQSFGVSFHASVPIELASAAIRTLELTDSLTLSQKYNVIQALPNLVLPELIDFFKQLSLPKEREFYIALDWTVLCICFVHNVTELINPDEKSEILSEHEALLVRAWWADGLLREYLFEELPNGIEVKQELLPEVYDLVAHLANIAVQELLQIRQYLTSIALIAVAYRIFRRIDQTEGVCANLLSNWGRLLKDLNQFEAAEQKYRVAWEVYFNGSLEGQEEYDADRAALLMKWGSVLSDLNQYEAALQKYEEAWDDYYEGALQGRTEYDADRASLLMNWGNVLGNLNQFKDAEQKYRIAWEVYFNGSLEGQEEYDSDRASLLMKWGIVLQDLNQFEAAEHQFISAWEVCFNGSLEGQEEYDAGRARVLVNWGNVLSDLNKFERAQEKYEAAWDDYYNGSLQGRTEYDADRARVLMNWGLLHQNLNQFEAASQKYEAAWDDYYNGSLQGRTEYDADRAGVLMNWGVLHQNLNQFEAASQKYEAAWDDYNNGALKSRLVLNPRRVDLLKNWLLLHIARAPEVPFDNAWAMQSSITLARMLEPSDWKEPTWTESQLSKGYQQFHRRWLQYCIDSQDYAQIPVIMSALQGRKLSRLLLDEVDTSESQADAPEVVKQLKTLRKQLRDIAHEIANLTGEFNRKATPAQGDEEDVDLRMVSRATPLSMAFTGTDFGRGTNPRLIELQTQQSQLMDDYHKVRDQVMTLPGYEALAAPYNPIKVEQLQAKLHTGQALLLLIDLPTLHAAWVLRHDGSQQLIPLDVDLAPLVQQLSASNLLGSSHAHLALREGPEFALRDTSTPLANSPLATTQFEGWDAYAAQLETGLWAPLAQTLSGIDSLHIVSHGRYHMLPLSLGMPAHFSMVHYPGLLFYSNADSTDNIEYTSSLPNVAFTYSGTDLPLAPHEARLLAHVWLQPNNNQANTPAPILHDAPVTGSKTQQVRLLCFAGHGSSDPDQPTNTRLILKKTKDVRDDVSLRFHDILTMPYQPRWVMLSACVAGRTHEDQDGDPLGIVTAFMLKDAQQVLACVSPVPDSYMPLLMLLTEALAYQKQLSLREALNEAKKRLKTWVEHEDLSHLIEPYQAWWQGIQQAAMRRELNQFDGESLQRRKEWLYTNIHKKLSDSAALVAELKAAVTEDELNAVQEHFLQAVTQQSSTQIPLIPPDSVVKLLTNTVLVFG